MSRIPRNALLQAIAAVKAMDDKQKELLADELFRVQPNLPGSTLVLARLGVSMDKVRLCEIPFASNARYR